MGKIFVIGMGPGSMEEMTPRAQNALVMSDLIIGYSAYIELLTGFFPEHKLVSSGMTREVERCRLVLEKALEGKNVALVSSGDSGIYGMAGLMLEIVEASGKEIEVEVIPGITAATAAAAVLGAPITHDFAVISLSDLLTPWELIQKRISCAAEGDFVICIYNPKSKGRSDYIDVARDLVLKHRNKETPVGIVRNAGRLDEKGYITTLDKMLDFEIDMFTTVIIGNSNTVIKSGKMITPRGYSI